MDLPIRPRRLRRLSSLRAMVRETELAPTDFIYPLFVRYGQDIREPIASMPGCYRWSVDRVEEEVGEVAALGIPVVLLFGIPEEKDEVGSRADADDGEVQQAIRRIKKSFPDGVAPGASAAFTKARRSVDLSSRGSAPGGSPPGQVGAPAPGRPMGVRAGARHSPAGLPARRAAGFVVIADVCLCEYTSHGHCGIVRGQEVLNDESVERLAQVAVSLARAGADVVAPSDMMDGRVGAIRQALDEAGLSSVAILAYSAKYASAFYGPFREAAESAPKFGDRRGYQMDPANVREALREIELDIAEGADMVMVKPALAYLDVVAKAREMFDVPIAAYNVSGEYAMVKAAAGAGWIDERQIVLEILTSIKRAGADMILTYHAKDAARWLSQVV